MVKAGILKEDDRIELIKGEISLLSPVGSKHASIVNHINAYLNIKLAEQAIVSIQNPIQIGHSSEPEPDIAIRKVRDDFYSEYLPSSVDVLLIIEVADTSLEYDQKIKLPIYAASGIPEYWIINLGKNRIEVYHAPENGKYKFQNYFHPKSVFKFP